MTSSGGRMKSFMHGWRFRPSKCAWFMTPLTTTVCVLALVSLVAGCASWIVKEERITLHHTQLKVNAIPQAATIAVGVQVNDKRDELAPGISRKWAKAVVGYGRNGLGEETYPDIIVTTPVAQTVRQSVESELNARGFQVADNATLQIVIDINVFFNDYKVGFIRSDSVADLNMDVKVLSNGNNRYSRRIVAQGHTAWAATMESRDAETALNMALDNGIDALFGDDTFISALLLHKQGGELHGKTEDRAHARHP